MNKIAQFVEHYRNLGRQAALADRQKTAGFLPNSRMARAGLGALGLACLLYTSPSPRDATLSRMPSSA